MMPGFFRDKASYDTPSRAAAPGARFCTTRKSFSRKYNHSPSASNVAMVWVFSTFSRLETETLMLRATWRTASSTSAERALAKKAGLPTSVVREAVNRADLLQAAGRYPPPPGASETIGMEVSGTVVSAGPLAGRQVCALLAGGGYAQYVAVPEGQIMPLPDGVDLIGAAGLPEVACTVWSNLVMTAHLRAGQLLLVHGGASGVGSHAIQVARALGATVAVTAGTPEKLDQCRELGAEHTINYRDDDFVARMLELGGADVILDLMGAAYLDRNIDALAPDGRIIVIGFQGGLKAELNFGKLMAKRAAMPKPAGMGPMSMLASIDASAGTVIFFRPATCFMAPMKHAE